MLIKIVNRFSFLLCNFANIKLVICFKVVEKLPQIFQMFSHSFNSDVVKLLLIVDSERVEIEKLWVRRQLTLRQSVHFVFIQQHFVRPKCLNVDFFDRFVISDIYQITVEKFVCRLLLFLLKFLNLLFSSREKTSNL